jgi:hypothetical protein
MPRFPILARRALALCLCACLVAVIAPAVPGFPPGGRVEVDPLVPADAGFVASVNLRQILDSPMVKKHAQAAVTAALAKDSNLGKALKSAGLDPLKDIDTLTVTGVADLDKPKWFAILRGRFDTDKILNLAAEHAKEHPDKLKVAREGDLTVVEFKDKPNSHFAAFADNRTLIVSPTLPETTAVVGRVSKAPASVNKAMQAALNKVNSRDIAYFAVIITDQMKKTIKGKQKDAAELVDPVESITGGLELTDAANLEVVIHTVDEDGAALIRKKIDEFRPLLNLLAGQEGNGPAVKAILDTIKVGNDKNSVTISLSVTEDVLKKAGPPKKPARKTTIPPPPEKP